MVRVGGGLSCQGRVAEEALKREAPMGIYNRDYIRDMAPAGDLSSTPVVKYLLIANVAVFLLQILIVRDANPASPIDPKTSGEQERSNRPATGKKPSADADQVPPDQEIDELLGRGRKVSVIQQWCELDTAKVVRQGQIWRLLTHAFCHDRYEIFHILINMICLYWFGPTLELMYGSREFLYFYLTAAVAAGLAFVGLDLYTGSTVPGIGASGAIMAVMMLYTMHFPTETIYVCWFFPLEMRWVMLFWLIWDLHPVLLALSGDPLYTGVAHAAHLGGLAFGFFYAKCEWNLEALADRLPGLRSDARRPRLGFSDVKQPTTPRDGEAGQIDEILQKISEFGQESLTEEEQTILLDASERLRNRQGRDDRR